MPGDTVSPTYYHAQIARGVSERELSEWVIEMAVILGWTVWHARDSRGQRLTGLPDLEMVRGPRRLRAELKTEKGRVSPIQEATISLLRASGERVEVWRPSSWVDGTIEEALR